MTTMFVCCNQSFKYTITLDTNSPCFILFLEFVPRRALVLVFLKCKAILVFMVALVLFAGVAETGDTGALSWFSVTCPVALVVGWR
jgi:hypothetical protein